MRSYWPAAQRIVVLCGPGNNGGDGYVLARLARARRLEVTVIALSDPQALRGDARQAWQDFVAAGGSTDDWSDDCLEGAEVVVDAIFGIGLSRALDEAIAACVRSVSMNAARRSWRSIFPAVSMPTPASIHGAAVHAERTLTFLGLKLGFYLGEGPNCTGIVMFDALDLPPEALAHVEPVGITHRRRRTCAPAATAASHHAQGSARSRAGRSVAEPAWQVRHGLRAKRRCAWARVS